jgi:hypothetical protein
MITALIAFAMATITLGQEEPASSYAPQEQTSDHRYSVRTLVQRADGEMLEARTTCSSDATCIVQLGGGIQADVRESNNEYTASVYVSDDDDPLGARCCLINDGSPFIGIMKPKQGAKTRVKARLIYDFQEDSLTYHPPIIFGDMYIIVDNDENK